MRVANEARDTDGISNKRFWHHLTINIPEIQQASPPNAVMIIFLQPDITVVSPIDISLSKSNRKCYFRAGFNYSTISRNII